MTINLKYFDWIVINSSAGKDSQTILDVVGKQAIELGIQDRVVVFHADLGRVEWPGTAELAEEQANRYGFRFEKIARPQGDLLTHIEQRGKFPDSARRYCTSDHKRGQGRKLLTQITSETFTGERPLRILNCMGFRRQESPARAKKLFFKKDESASNKTKRHVYEYCPILDWSEDEVWENIHKSGVRYHWAYDEGMPRLSCCFCVLASESALIRASQLRPNLALEYKSVESRIGHKFKQGLSMAEIIEKGKLIKTTQIDNWAA
ncbi:phosphoadenosine phosphosulfate reductase family protein [Aliikangiella coralliicola]|uniref:Phosphoadenosine phosphosulfate reductase family protein n=1 Tax=Aliikangiella coralliicola TaxID=2592383 RepID=A0A545U0C6_9GAMM|nr:phosphoadenosine phosphosulfate reductase family protein [Aliikangiella coralliicola]TQV82883.1 phosphoadenosine phosphosulfate reductase family protein [Aliikangiella coralliicola]